MPADSNEFDLREGESVTLDEDLHFGLLDVDRGEFGFNNEALKAKGYDLTQRQTGFTARNSSVRWDVEFLYNIPHGFRVKVTKTT